MKSHLTACTGLMTLQVSREVLKLIQVTLQEFRTTRTRGWCYARGSLVCQEGAVQIRLGDNKVNMDFLIGGAYVFGVGYV